MTNRNLGFIIKDQNPLILSAHISVQHACQHMWSRRVGAVLITDDKGLLTGIFTGRDAVRTLGEDREPRSTPLAAVMTAKPDTIDPEATAIDALRMMSDGGYRHLPIVVEGKILGIVSRGDFRGLELDRLEEETGLWEKLG
ncbi:MAG: signal transduction protein [Betaproteobacteria bacterium HGW-Betaproteobacteria-11]|nr:MAG: signal transduction protein [Betaproteobacteria bacterium HGW-Betaproteobacteria-11]